MQDDLMANFFINKTAPFKGRKDSLNVILTSNLWLCGKGRFQYQVAYITLKSFYKCKTKNINLKLIAINVCDNIFFMFYVTRFANFFAN